MLPCGCSDRRIINEYIMSEEPEYYLGYAIASTSNVCGGHGCYYDEVQITPEDGYGTGELPPIFPTEDEAKAYIKKKKMFLKDVVKIRLAI